MTIDADIAKLLLACQSYIVFPTFKSPTGGQEIVYFAIIIGESKCMAQLKKSEWETFKTTHTHIAGKCVLDLSAQIASHEIKAEEDYFLAIPEQQMASPNTTILVDIYLFHQYRIKITNTLNPDPLNPPGHGKVFQEL